MEIVDRILDGEETPVQPVEKKWWNGFTRVFQWSNEDHTPVFEHFDFTDASVLGITGSGDFELSTHSYRVGDVVSVDQSIYSLLFTEIKAAAAAQLDRETFLDFFCLPDWVDNTHAPTQLPEKQQREDDDPFFNAETYATLRPALSAVTQQFFDETINAAFKTKQGGKVPYPTHFLHYVKQPAETQLSAHPGTQRFPYLTSRERYKTMQEQLRNDDDVSNRHVEDIYAFTPPHTDFDFVYLSNIPDDPIYKTRNLTLLEQSREWINEEGTIIFYGWKREELDNLVAELRDRDLHVEQVGGHNPKKSSQSSCVFPAAYCVQEK